MIQNSSKEIAPQCAASASCCCSSSPRWRPDRTARPRDRFKPGRRSRARRPQAWLLLDPAQRDRSDRASSSVAAAGGSATPRPMAAVARPISGKPGLLCDLAPNPNACDPQASPREQSGAFACHWRVPGDQAARAVRRMGCLLRARRARLDASAALHRRRPGLLHQPESGCRRSCGVGLNHRSNDVLAGVGFAIRH